MRRCASSVELGRLPSKLRWGARRSALPEGERLALGQRVREQQIVLPPVRVQRLREGDEIAGDEGVPWCSSWKNECCPLLPGSPQTIGLVA